MQIFVSRLFERQIKKLHKNEKLALDKEVRRLVNNPELGKRKKGELKEVFIYKYKFQSKEFLISYRLQEESLELIMYGTHENYYRDLKKYLE